MNSTTVTNADGSITTIIKMHPTHHFIWAQTLAPVALILIIVGLVLLFRKERPNFPKKNQ